jgi:hypothetical protein
MNRALQLCVLCLLCCTTLAAQTAGSFTATGSMTPSRATGAAVRLNDGKVFVAAPTDQAPQLYDPATGLFSSATTTGTLLSGIETVTLLASGKLLITAKSLAQIYDPTNKSFVSTGTMPGPALRSAYTATLLTTGKVLIAGGGDNVPAGSINWPCMTGANSSLIYDPALGTFSVGPVLQVPRAKHTATLLPSGKVLLVAGTCNNTGGDGTYTSELFDPAANGGAGAFVLGPSLGVRRVLHSAARFGANKVLIAGGYNFSRNKDEASVEAYDAGSNTFSYVTPPCGCISSGEKPSLATLLDGTVLSYYPPARVYTDRPTGATVLSADPPAVSHTFPMLATLNNGKVLAAGGTVAELFDPTHPGLGLQLTPTAAAIGANVLIKATIGNPNATGSVTFSYGTTTIGTVPLNSSGVAQVTTAFSTIGTHNVMASYSGDAFFQATGSNADEFTYGEKRMAGIGDFNGDGKSDILWRHTDGTTGMWLLNGTAFVASANIAVVPNTLTVAGVGDFNGDGKSDILWRDSLGGIGMWLMNGLNIQGGAYVSEAPPSYAVVGIGDFNGDHKADILWQDPLDNVGLWLMNGSTIAAGAYVGAAPSLRVAGIGDFDHNGTSDILWVDVNRYLGIWLMSGGAIIGGASLGQLSFPSVVGGVGDYTGDLRADIIIREPQSGALSLWVMSGLTVQNKLLIGGSPNTLTMRASGDYNGDGLADILWNDLASRDVGMWIMSGTVISSGGYVAGAPPGWSIQ